MTESEQLALNSITRVPPIPVFPVRMDKGPFPGFHWRSRASTDLEQIRLWSNEYPEHRWAVPGGKRSGLLFLDLDSRRAISASEHLGLNGGEVRPTLTPEHGRVTFAWQGAEGCWNARSRDSVALDIKGEGGYCVIYEPIPKNTPDPPPWLLLLCRDEWLRHDVDGPAIREGARNSTLTSLAGKMRVRGLTEREISVRLGIINEFRCDVPLPEREVSGVAKSIGQYTNRASSARAGGTPSTSVQSPTPLGRQSVLPLFDPKSGEPDPNAFAEYLCSVNPFASPEDTYTATGCELLRYEGGVYGDDGRPFAHRIIEEEFHLVGKIAGAGFPEEVTKAIARRSMVKRDAFNPPGKLCVKNGVLDLASGELGAHNPAVRFTRKLPFSFVQGAECPRFKTFLSEVLSKDDDRREIQKVAGYLFEVGNRHQVAVMLVGEGDNGKSTLLGALVDMLGKGNVAAASLQSLSENRFATAALFGKVANVCADLPDTPLRYSGVFKMLTGGDEVPAELKFGAIFHFRNDAKLLFSCNKLPEVNDRTFAFWRRWLLFRFDGTFTGRADRNLPEKLREELPGILNWALDGLRLLQEDGGFRPGLTSSDLKDEWRKRSDSLFWFISDGVEQVPNTHVARDDLYEAYSDFCDEHGVSRKSQEVVAKELRTLLPGVRAERPRIQGVQVRVWTGIRLKLPRVPSANPTRAAERLSERGEGGGLAAFTAEPDNPNGGVPHVPGGGHGATLHRGSDGS